MRYATLNISPTEYSQAVDFVDRALFTYERSFIGAFNFTSGSNRLDFDRVENRPFFLALHRQVTCVPLFFFIYSPVMNGTTANTAISSVEAASEQLSSSPVSCTRLIHGQTHMAHSYILITSPSNRAWVNGC